MPQIWTRDFIIVTCTNFLVAMNFHLLMVTIPLFSIESFGSPPAEAGLAASVFVLGALVARPLAGRWIDRVERKRFLCAGLALWVITTLLYFPVNGIVALFVVRFLNGLAFGVTSTSMHTIATSIIPAERRGEGLGFYMLSTVVATALGPSLAIVVSQAWGFSTLFSMSVAVVTLSLGSVLVLTVPRVQLTATQVAEMKGFKLSNFVEGKAVPISIVCGLVVFCYSSVNTFVAPYAKELGAVDAASYFFLVLAGTIFVSRPFAGRLFDSKGENFVMLPAIPTLAIGLFALSQTHYGATLLIAGALIGLGFGILQSSGLAIVVRVSSPHRLGLANSTFYSFFDAGAGLGPFVLGFLVPAFGYSGLYLSAAVIVLGCTFLYYALHGRHAVVPGEKSAEASRPISRD